MTEPQLSLALEQRREITERLTPLFEEVSLDLNARTPSE